MRLCLLALVLLTTVWGRAQGSELKSETFPGGDVGARVAAADARMGASGGAIAIESPGTISTTFTLGKGHGLVLRAPVTWKAPVDLAGGNEIWCEGKGGIVAALPFGPGTSLLRAKGVSGIKIHDCPMSSDAPQVLLWGLAISQLEMSRNTLTGMALISTSAPGIVGGEGFTFTDNSIDFPKGMSPMAGMLLAFVKGVTASGNRMSHVVNGIQWWGGDSGVAGVGLGQVTGAGQMTFTKNVCRDVGSSCLWGSMGYDIVMRGNSADGCGDVCFDTEGGLRTTISENTATGCKNGCAAIFFFSDQTSITKNRFSGATPGGGLILVKNVSQDPARHDHVKVADNVLNCGAGLCRAVYQEAVGGFRFERNQVVNGTYASLGFGRAVRIAQNHFTFSVPVGAGDAAIVSPAVIGGTQLDVLGNVLESSVEQGAGARCIVAGWKDYNNNDVQIITGNTCGGTKPFPIAIQTITDGKNPGPHGIWVLNGNHTGGGKVEHVAVTRNELYFDFGECTEAGCRVNERAVGAAGQQAGRCEAASFGAVVRGTGGSVQVCAAADGGFEWRALPLPR